MEVGFVLTRFRNLIVNPSNEWSTIENEELSKWKVFRNFAVPFFVLVALCSALGDYAFASRQNFSIVYVLIKAVGVFGIACIGTFVSSAIINELTVSFNSVKNSDTSLKLVIYSLSAYYIVSAMVLLLPFLNILWIFEGYSIYLFWLGAEKLLKTPLDNKPGFVVVSGLITVGIFAILNRILEQILLGVLGYNILGH